MESINSRGLKKPKKSKNSKKPKLPGKIKTKLRALHNKRYNDNEGRIQLSILKEQRKHPGQVTVKEVSKDAGISRQTCYNHHDNINQAISENEAALLEKLTAELKAAHSSKNDFEHNNWLFRKTLFFIMHNKEYFCELCSDREESIGQLFRMIKMAVYPRLKMHWLPDWEDAPDIDSERVFYYLLKCAGIIFLWARNTGCDINETGKYVQQLLRATDNAERNRGL